MRIVSLIPSATEVACALGLGDHLVGVTHECDYPESVRALPKLTRSMLPEGLTSAEIDVAVAASLTDEHTVYELDVELLAKLEPDVVLTQSLCEVCAVPRALVDEAVCSMPQAAQVISLDPSTIEEMLDDLLRVAEEFNRRDTGEALVGQLKRRLEAVTLRTADVAYRPRVFCVEWVDPIFCAGHWLPGMTSIAGGVDGLGRPGVDSGRVTWEQVQAWSPEVIVVMPCGFDAKGALEQARGLTGRPGLSELPAVQAGNVFVVDANAYFARPGPRLVDGTEIMARLFHPELFDSPLGENVAFKLETGESGRFQPFR